MHEQPDPLTQPEKFPGQLHPVWLDFASLHHELAPPEAYAQTLSVSSWPGYCTQSICTVELHQTGYNGVQCCKAVHYTVTRCRTPISRVPQGCQSKGTAQP